MWSRADTAEYRICRRFNKAVSVGFLRHVFRLASRLGDGGFWLVMLALLPCVYGSRAIECDVSLLITSAFGMSVYWALKRYFARHRPFVTHAEIRQGAPALDQYSFPSGHTMNAVNFSFQICGHFPHLAPVLLPLTFMIALSRLALGLHYPTDVVAGALLGSALALLGGLI